MYDEMVAVQCVYGVGMKKRRKYLWYVVRHVLNGKGGVIIFDEACKGFGTLAISF